MPQVLTLDSSVKSVDDLVARDNLNSVIQVKLDGGEQALASAIQLLLCEYLRNISLRNSMTDDQIELAASLMIEEYPHLPVNAFPIFFRNCLLKKYGEHYNSIDIPKLMGWMEKFYQDYMSQVEEQAYQEHVSTKGDNANFVDILQKHKALAAAEEDEAVPMPDDFFKNLREKKKRKEIEERVHKENIHLYSHMSVAEADSVIDALIKNELLNNNIKF